ncbi:protein phosphatase 1 regulatory subunit 12C isoform X4 [Dromaius novaehollandiae]|uniref:protein phosphatase 1 regulatory subunit 12C isoform X4 n=1 Tax=Dromaius novaehollandiae TaxID=8790 RepID=UPI00311EA033
MAPRPRDFRRRPRTEAGRGPAAAAAAAAGGDGGGGGGRGGGGGGAGAAAGAAAAVGGGGGGGGGGGAPAPPPRARRALRARRRVPGRLRRRRPGRGARHGARGGARAAQRRQRRRHQRAAPGLHRREHGGGAVPGGERRRPRPGRQRGLDPAARGGLLRLPGDRPVPAGARGQRGGGEQRRGPGAGRGRGRRHGGPAARRGVDVAAAKREEEERMLRDTRQWLNAGKISDARHPATGASALHVAAAKGYIEVMRLLLQAGHDPDVRDKDGWTPLHAAAHWGVEEACRLLAEHLCDMAPRNNVGQRPCDLADEDTLPLLEELQRRQDHLRSQKEPPVPPALIEPGPEPDPAPAWSSKHRRSSVCRMSSREKISVQDQSKEPALGAIALPEDDSGDEADEGPPLPPPEPPAEAPAESCTPNGVPPAGKAPGGPPWGLRKTGSLGALPPPGAPRDGAVKRSASSPRLAAPDKQDIWELLQQWNRTLIGPGSANKSAALEPANWEEGSAAGDPSKEPRLARVPPTPTRRIFALPDAPPRTPPDGGLQAKPDTGAAPPVPPAPSADPRPRRSYQTPVRDEESESQRKARSRLMRQSRRSTQGVTLTELKEAEKTIGRGGEGRAPEQRIREDERRDREEGAPPLESADSSWRSRVLAAPGPPGSQAKKGPETEAPGPEAEAEPRSRPGARERRKPRRERRGPGAELYEELWAENEKLKEQLQETELKLTQIKLELERVTQRQERIAERPALLELERFERRALERKAAELEEELKALSDLKADNQRLKDENAALIRVISKLSK